MDPALLCVRHMVHGSFSGDTAASCTNSVDVFCRTICVHTYEFDTSVTRTAGPVLKCLYRKDMLYCSAHYTTLCTHMHTHAHRHIFIINMCITFCRSLTPLQLGKSTPTPSPVSYQTFQRERRRRWSWRLARLPMHWPGVCSYRTQSHTPCMLHLCNCTGNVVQSSKLSYNVSTCKLYLINSLHINCNICYISSALLSCTASAEYLCPIYMHTHYIYTQFVLLT